jgi:hypothetical protein
MRLVGTSQEVVEMSRMIMSRGARWRFGVVLVAVVLGLAATACAKKNSPASGGSSSGGMWVKITSPTAGASVKMPLTIQLQASVPLGDPSTGEHHVHLCVDGASCDSGNYVLVYGNSGQITGLSAGTHTITASLRNADHSAAGAQTSVTVTVSGSGGGGTSSSPSTHYGY